MQKNRMIALLLKFFLGLAGADRFYLGKYRTGTLKLLALGGLGVWWCIDGVLLMIDAFLYSLGKDSGCVKDARGHDLKHGLSMYRLKNGSLVRD
ncbi:TM2 domain-containing protein [Cupriavidus basilensis]|uniref:TM2 domain-containing protein n=1 Tax=Cupriavidus basilensis TaxID=68895 RepID=A0ABT6B1K5_9BURK|nr:TM2 domain-containing protein [Cupriavidus basilensis]MDF3838769.1 TM2 domain-containing protein [Cupriavidus basilensis]